MIITRTPYRVSFLGGGTDYKDWYERHGGRVLTSTIDRYCYITVRPLSHMADCRYRIQYRKTENVDTRSAIEHSGVRGCLEYLGIDRPLEIHHAGDLPARSGLGSSSCFTVGMLNALHALEGRRVSRAQLAYQAIKVEQEVLRETVGIQDQIECATGGLNMIEIDTTGRHCVTPILIGPGLEDLERHLILFFTGLQRTASTVASTQVQNFARREKELRQIADLVPLGAAAMRTRDWRGLGELLDTSWRLKRSLAEKVSTPEIDKLYTKAREAGAWGGKVLGAGSGGFLLFVAPPEIHTNLKTWLQLRSVPVRFEHQGAQVILG